MALLQIVESEEKKLTSRTFNAGKFLISDDNSFNLFDAKISFLKSTCSHQRSPSPVSKEALFPSSGTSKLILQTWLQLMAHL